MASIKMCKHCNKNPIAIKKSHLCSSCYQKLRRENVGRIPKHSSEIDFIKNYFTHSNWTYESATFNLEDCKYTPDFYDAEENVYIEVVASLSAYKNNEKKYNLFQKLFPYLSFEIRTPDGKILDGKHKWPSGITIPNFDKNLHARAKVAAAIAEITLKDWIERAIREKLDNDR